MPSDMKGILRDTSTSSDIDYALINTSISLEVMPSEISVMLSEILSSDINNVLRNMSLEITMPSQVILCIRRYPKVL